MHYETSIEAGEAKPSFFDTSSSSLHKSNHHTCFDGSPAAVTAPVRLVTKQGLTNADDVIDATRSLQITTQS